VSREVLLALTIGTLANDRAAPQTLAIEFLLAISAIDAKAIRPLTHWPPVAPPIDSLEALLLMRWIASVEPISAALTAEAAQLTLRNEAATARKAGCSPRITG